MLTGDNQATASAAAREARIDGAHGNLLPEHATMWMAVFADMAPACWW